jgi:23S rRNA (adenine2503-C2)-methyltransferase
MIDKIDLYSMLPEELEEYFVSLGEPKFRAKQVFPRLDQGAGIDGLTNLSKALRQRLSEECVDTLPRVEEKLVSKIDGTVKYLFRLYDGSCIESVFMKYKHGNTLCISSQVGCYMGCKFCASTIGGKVRDLYPSELLGQIIAAELDSGERISNIVMMGIGEPLDNFDNVIKFLKLVNHPDGINIGYRHISLSTCGVVPGIYKLAEIDIPITLSISLHASNDEKRTEIMPVNKKYNINKIVSASKYYFEKTGRRVIFEYTLIKGTNDSPECAKELATLTRGFPSHVNLIRLNEVKERNHKAPTEDATKEFLKRLEALGVSATIRRSLGNDIEGACGQLRRRYLEEQSK